MLCRSGANVQFFQSIICLKGNDNRLRFLAIILAITLLSIIITASLKGMWVVNIIALTLLSFVHGTATLRRLNDALLTKHWLLANTGVFVLVNLAIIIFATNIVYWLLLLSLSVSAILLTYPSKNQQEKSYIFGYWGPVDLSQYQAVMPQTNQRIEPTFANHAASDVNDHQAFAQNMTEQQLYQSTNGENKQAAISTNQSDLGETIRNVLFNNNNAKITLISVIVIVLLAMVISGLLSLTTASKPDEANEPVIAPIKPAITRLHPVTLPDNFTVLLSDFDGLIIHWQADETDITQLWTIERAQGDTSCQQITFNDNSKFRTTSVLVEQTSDYYAQFSPLDTKLILQALAFRGSFELCGYKFSLKGSQAALGKNAPYADYIDY